MEKSDLFDVLAPVGHQTRCIMHDQRPDGYRSLVENAVGQFKQVR